MRLSEAERHSYSLYLVFWGRGRRPPMMRLLERGVFSLSPETASHATEARVHIQHEVRRAHEPKIGLSMFERWRQPQSNYADICCFNLDNEAIVRNQPRLFDLSVSSA